MSSAAVPVVVRSLPSAFGAGAVIGVLGFVGLAAVIIPRLVTLLLASSVKVWRYQ